MVESLTGASFSTDPGTRPTCARRYEKMMIFIIDTIALTEGDRLRRTGTTAFIFFQNSIPQHFPEPLQHIATYRTGFGFALFQLLD